METLADILEPYKESIGNGAMVVTIIQMLSGIQLCLDIYMQDKSEGIPIMPFAGGFVVSALNLKYGYIILDQTMIIVNFVGVALNLIYLTIYYLYSRQKKIVRWQVGRATALTITLLVYAHWEDAELVEKRFGMITTVLLLGLIASPLFSLNTIIKNQSTEGMPFPVIATGTVVAIMWLLYGIALKNGFIVVPNVVALLLCAVQMSLFVIYPSKPKPVEKPKSKSKKILKRRRD